MYICIYVCMYVCMYVYIYIYIYIYIYSKHSGIYDKKYIGLNNYQIYIARFLFRKAFAVKDMTHFCSLAIKYTNLSN